MRESGRGEGEGAIGQARHRGHAAAAPEAGPSDDHPKLLHSPQNKNKKTNTTFPQVLLKKEGSEEGAVGALGRVMMAAHGHLAKVANGEELFPRFHLADPVFAADVTDLPHALEGVVGQVAGKVKGKLGLGGDHKTPAAKFRARKTFFRFAPCVLRELHTGFAADAVGLNFVPELFGFKPTIGRANLAGLQINPRLIFINPMGVQVQPQGALRSQRMHSSCMGE